MTGSPRLTTRPFTLVLCAACDSSLGPVLLDQLRATVRRARHGMLVTAGCPLGEYTCLARDDGGGAILMFQPCSTSRVALGPARWIGPIDNLDDLHAACSWVARGRWESDRLPERLCFALPASRRAVTTN
ncbi:hypothetical protein [Mycolicibacterium sarraceniae]|uniref:Uncharacterized protein n=1 Tax=Mycolicibacterium sarraceniae TaxID=1534348 RepID=A0A7I7SUU8_9MYCO|nr:hypothetical protein [Mycolicibacterium sarraceniae]BBY60578.1 hypothetical protein MSAR_37140 [Mycolicibacterium sarraceniae]